MSADPDELFLRGFSVLYRHDIIPDAAVSAVRDYLGLTWVAAGDAAMELAADWDEIPVAHTVNELAPWLCDHRGGRFAWSGPVDTPKYSLGDYRQEWRSHAERVLHLWHLMGLE